MSSSQEKYIVWLDVETTGVDPDKDLILEIGCLLSDMSGSLIGEPFHMLVDSGSFSDVYKLTSDDVKELHQNNNLWEELWSKETYKPSVVDKELVVWLADSGVNAEDVVYLGGNSITLDRVMTKSNFPFFYSKLSHRSIDVTSISLFLENSFHTSPFYKKTYHRALSDCYLSLEEYQYFIQELKTGRATSLIQ